MHTPDLPAGIEFSSEPMPSLHVNTPAAEAVVLLQGAQVLHWQPEGQRPVLWTSPNARFEEGAVVRGGVPVCFPWFGPGREQDDPTTPMSPSHGWARISEWRLQSATVDADGTAELVFELPADAGEGTAHEEALPTDARVHLTMRLGERLDLALSVRAGEVLVDVEEALHTYFAVSDLASVRIEGLDGVPCLDKVTGESRDQQGDVTIEGEVDRIYDLISPVRIVDADRTIELLSAGSESTIVWNPGPDKAAAMADMGAGVERGMVCVETGNVLARAITVAPGHDHVMSVCIRVV